MKSVEELVTAGRDPRLGNQPVWIRNLVHDLAHRLDAEHRYSQALVEQAKESADEATALLTEGPADSDTFLDLPRSVTRYSDDAEGQRPLGKGATIEFRDPELSPGEGINVKLVSGRGLVINGMNHLAVVPLSTTSLYIETR